MLLVGLPIPLSIIIIWFGARMTWLSYVQDEGSRAALGLSSRWIIKSALPIGAFFLLLAACYRLVDMFGWSDLLGSHISARVPGEENAFLINPYGLLFDEITASSLVKIDEDGNILSPTEYHINPAGFI